MGGCEFWAVWLRGSQFTERPDNVSRTTPPCRSMGLSLTVYSRFDFNFTLDPESLMRTMTTTATNVTRAEMIAGLLEGMAETPCSARAMHILCSWDFGPETKATNGQPVCSVCLRHLVKLRNLPVEGGLTLPQLYFYNTWMPTVERLARLQKDSRFKQRPVRTPTDVIPSAQELVDYIASQLAAPESTTDTPATRTYKRNAVKALRREARLAEKPAKRVRLMDTDSDSDSGLPDDEDTAALSLIAQLGQLPPPPPPARSPTIDEVALAWTQS